MLRSKTVGYLVNAVRATTRSRKMRADQSCAALTTHPAVDPFQMQEMRSHQLILVDENDRVVGTESKLNCHLVKNGVLPLHRAFSVLLFNSKNELVLQQRSATKVFAPNQVTNACCSHPLYDASSAVNRDRIDWCKLAARDRLIFELGMPPADVSCDDLHFLGRILYRAVDEKGVSGEHEMDYIFVMRKDVHMVPHPMEIERIWSVPRQEFVSFVQNLQYPLTPWFKILVKDWLFKIWDHLDKLEKVTDVEKIHKYY